MCVKKCVFILALDGRIVMDKFTVPVCADMRFDALFFNVF